MDLTFKAELVLFFRMDELWWFLMDDGVSWELSQNLTFLCGFKLSWVSLLDSVLSLVASLWRLWASLSPKESIFILDNKCFDPSNYI